MSPIALETQGHERLKLMGSCTIVPPLDTFAGEEEGPDLAVKVIQPPAKAVQSYDYAGAILKHPQLSKEEKQSMLWVLAQCPAFHKLIPISKINDHEMPEWVHCSTSSSRWEQSAVGSIVVAAYKLQGATFTYT